MFINWAHFLIPKIFSLLSFITNPVLVYLIHTEKSFQFGSYKYLLYFFALFNIIASLADTLVPVCVHAYRYATVFFTVNGPFSEIMKFQKSSFGEFLLSGRCAFISGTYGILNSHFIYRYLSLKNHHFVAEYFNPYGLILSVLLVVVHWTLWVVVADITMVADLESRNYVRVSFEKVYGSLEGLNMKTVIFSEVSSQVVYRSWFGTLFVTALASYSITLYFVLGYKIMSSLNQGLDYMSDRTLQMQRRLFWALAIQTAIPICVSFMPCILVLYGSAFRIDFLSWVNWMSSVAVSFFPFLDPLAITMCLPTLRHRIFCRLRNISPNFSNRVYSSSRI
ncbi:hypothetical protein B9Z55_018181 [Caenorhabditis nigoni]|uniref:G-protein coupled receptors family 1 profile domain-containing protein n=1 Tax=Caenorhabditis nigoni TaxID=1611254 RepID=A0A2G5TD84_9PELO|nr:hypothetical protein B9Z55_018181 [Caenorhabditis nigoni]